MVQTWGSVPRCNLTDPTASCQDKETGADVCCTESCQVVALPETVSTPSVTLVNADDISQGIQVRWLWLAGVLRRRRVQKACWQWRRGVARYVRWHAGSHPTARKAAAPPAATTVPHAPP